jgi:transglutaminase-like putative cysteine protease
VRESLAYRASWRPDTSTFEAMGYLFESPHVRLKRDLRAYSETCFTPGRPILEAADALMAKIHHDFRFDPMVTTVNTPVMTFFKERSGVCQDFTHLMISCLRSIGLAARYMSGYLRTDTASSADTLVGADASHAWAALFIPAIGWVDLDPTNNVRAGQNHVVLGWGRDFSDITPLRGVINAGGDQMLKVSVTVTPV